MSKKNESQAPKLVYEVGFLLDSKLAEDKLATKVAGLRELVSQGAGTVIAEGEPKARTLAHIIITRRDGKRADHTKAWFGWIKFEQDPNLIKDLDAKLKADKDIVRYLLIKTVKEDTMAHVKELEESDESNSSDEEDVEDFVDESNDLESADDSAELDPDSES